MNKNKKTLDDFTAYCEAHPDERFWQALRNWTRQGFILTANDLSVLDHPNVQDTYYWEKRDR